MCQCASPHQIAMGKTKTNTCAPAELPFNFTPPKRDKPTGNLMTLEIHIVPCLSDNYAYVLKDLDTGKTALVDAPDAAPVIQELDSLGWSLDILLITHHHADHTDGISALVSKYGCAVYGPRSEQSKISGLDHMLDDGDFVSVGNTKFEVIETPGHTLGHICFYDAEGPNLFSADALFSLGCGRMFEGTPGPMWEGLKRLRDLPDATTVFAGHEYTAGNAGFAVSIENENESLKSRAHDVTRLRDQNLPTMPFNLGEDKKANPFLRADDAQLAASLGMGGKPAADVFGDIRKRKDHF